MKQSFPLVGKTGTYFNVKYFKNADITEYKSLYGYDSRDDWSYGKGNYFTVIPGDCIDTNILDHHLIIAILFHDTSVYSIKLII